MRLFILILFCVGGFSLTGQQALIPLHSFYKDQFLSNKFNKPYNEGSFFPESQKDYSLQNVIRDSSDQYYDFTEVLFKKHLIEISGDDYHINISPAIDWAYGKDFEDTIDRTLFQNTRGFYIEGNLFDNFAFATSLYENQGRYTSYESDYYTAQGEMYPLHPMHNPSGNSSEEGSDSSSDGDGSDSSSSSSDSSQSQDQYSGSFGH